MTAPGSDCCLYLTSAADIHIVFDDAHMTITETIADYICAELHRPLPETVTHHAKRAVIDWFAAMYSGAVQEPNPMLRQALINNDDARQAIIFPDGQYSTVKTAAFLNGASAHTSEFDDIFRDGGFHPGCATIAAALAVGQRHSRPGVMFLRSVIAGYEVSSRISAAMGRDHFRFWHTTGTIATFGATAAAGQEQEGEHAQHNQSHDDTLDGGRVHGSQSLQNEEGGVTELIWHASSGVREAVAGAACLCHDSREQAGGLAGFRI